MAQPFDHAFDRGWFLGLRMREVTPLVVSAQTCEHSNMSTITPTGAPVVKLTGLAKLPSLAFRTMTETMRVVSGLAAWTAWRMLGGSRTAA